MTPSLNGSRTIAHANYPSGGKAGKYVEINSDFNYFTHGDKKWTMIHEFGHILGLAHTDLIKTGESLISGTPETDYSSVMQSLHPETGWRGFSQGDLAAIQILYGNPVWNLKIEGPDNIPEKASAKYTMTYQSNIISEPDYEWYLNGVRMNVNSRSIDLTLSNGSNTIRGEATFAGKTISTIFPKTVNTYTYIKPTLSANATKGSIGDIITVTVANPDQTLDYEWSLNTTYARIVSASRTNATIEIIAYEYSRIQAIPGPFTLKYRNNNNAFATDWSEITLGSFPHRPKLLNSNL